MSDSQRLILFRSAAFLILGGAALAWVGCASTSETTPAPSTAAAASTAPPPFATQVADGQKLYGQHCAGCHGDAGEGGAKAPRVVGVAQGALPLDPPADRKVRKSRFVTVADVADFAVANMPPGKGGSLPANQYWDILAFDLHANGIDLPQPLTPELAKTLTIPR
jgi:cytochrome c